MRSIFSKLAFLAMLCASLLSSCTPDIEMPPPPPSDNPISSSAQVWSYCVYPEIEMCYPGSYSACPGIGGVLRNNCPYSNSNSVQSSSSGNTVGNSSSSQAGQGNSSGGTAQEYNYCVFAVERNCLTGPLTLCPPGGELSNNCPYNSSSSKQSSSNSVAGSSSSSQVNGNVFTDPRDGKKYKFEVATDGKIWMSENLNYSRDNTLGYCYGVDINGANPHRDSTTCGNGYGRLYEWTVAMDGKSSQGLCPNGWHIPSTAEWNTIIGTSSMKNMSSTFYIYPGNYNPNAPVGWKERDESGFYWTSSGNSYFTGFWDGSLCKRSTNPTCIVEAGTGALATDRFSVRCMADEDIKFSCGTNTYSPYTNFCADNLVYTKCGGKEYKPATEFCSGTNVYSLCSGEKYDPPTEFCSSNSIYSKCGGKEYKPEKFECVNGVLNPIAADYVITCNGGFNDNANCENNKRTVTLRDDECVEINVMGYTNQMYLPNIMMRCDATSHNGTQSVSVTLNLNGTSKTYSGSYSVLATVELGNLKLGDNKFGFLCVTDLRGVNEVECRGSIN